jgi:hypothetical protein
MGTADMGGNSLGTGGTSNPWTFTTGTAAALQPAALGSSAAFGDFGGTAGMTNSGSLTAINGNIGTTAVSTGVVDFHDNTVIIAGVDECSYTETPIDTGGLVDGNISVQVGWWMLADIARSCLVVSPPHPMLAPSLFMKFILEA